MSDLKELILQKNKTIKEKDYIKISVSNIKDLLHAPFESEIFSLPINLAVLDDTLNFTFSIKKTPLKHIIINIRTSNSN